jgi:hypothetical protein
MHRKQYESLKGTDHLTDLSRITLTWILHILGVKVRTGFI